MIVELAPVEKQMFSDNNTLSQGWIQFLSSLNGLSGEWSADQWPFSVTGASSQPICTLGFLGKVVHFSIVWSDSVTFSSASTETPLLNGQALPLVDSVLNVWDGSTLVGGAIVNNKTITFPDGNFSECRVVGSAIIKES